MQKKEKWSYVVSALKIEQYPNGTRIKTAEIILR